MTASLTDILTTAKNIVTAINGAAQTYLNVNGTQVRNAMTGTTPVLVNSGQGRLVTVSVVVTSTSAGTIYDSNSTGSLTNQIGTIPTVTGVYTWNIPYNNGIIVVPGSGQTITVTYS